MPEQAAVTPGPESCGAPHSLKFSEVLELNSKRTLGLLALGWTAVFAACEEETTVEPPRPDPQIGVAATYGKATNDQGEQIGLPSTDVYAFLAVSNGEFWIGTAAGIAKYPDVTATTHSGPEDIVNELNGLPHPKVRAMVEYGGKVYVATWGGGLGVYDVALGTWTAIRATTNGLRSDFVADIAVSLTETPPRLYFATNRAVSIYNPAAGTFTSFVNGLLDPLVSCVEVATVGGTLQRWYGPRVDEKTTPAQIPNHGITVSKVSSLTTYTTANSGLAEPNVNDIVYDAARGVFWVAYSTEGLAEVNVPAKTWITHTLVQGLPSGTVNSVALAGGKVWAATQSGLAELQAGRWQGYGRSGGLPADRARRLYSDDGTRLWLGLVEGGAVRVKTD
jgi:ligand-binding sensor domain-containing protein